MIRAEVSASGQYTSLASRAARSSGSVAALTSGSQVASMAPLTNPKTSMPNSRRKTRASAPAATRAAVSRALARSSVPRQSVVSHLMLPARSACPGRGRVTGGVLAASSRRLSLLGTSSATGEPSVTPARTPVRTRTTSVSIRWRPPRP